MCYPSFPAVPRSIWCGCGAGSTGYTQRSITVTFVDSPRGYGFKRAVGFRGP